MKNSRAINALAAIFLMVSAFYLFFGRRYVHIVKFKLRDDSTMSIKPALASGSILSWRYGRQFPAGVWAYDESNRSYSVKVDSVRKTLILDTNYGREVYQMEDAELIQDLWSRLTKIREQLVEEHPEDFPGEMIKKNEKSK